MDADRRNEVTTQDENPYEPPGRDSLSGDDEGRRRSLANLGWVLAISLGCFVQLMMSRSHYFTPRHPSLTAIGLVLDLCQGALAAVGVCVLGRAIMRRQFGTLMPGHWLAISYVAFVVGTISSWCVDSSGPIFFAGDVIYPKDLVLALATNIGGTVFFVAVGLHSRESQVWKIYAWLNVALYIGYLIRLPAEVGGRLGLAEVFPPTTFAMVTLAATMLAMWAARLSFLIGLVQDARHRTQRDLPHWLGIALGSINPAVVLIVQVYFIDTIA